MSARKRPPDDEPCEPDSFAEAARSMGDVKVLPRDKQTADGKTTKPPPPDRSREETPDPFHFPVPHQPLLGHVPGLRQRELRRLRAGKLRPETTVDLHNQDRASANSHLQHALVDACRAGQRCVLVIHGRGMGSEGGEAVLRQTLPRWLAEPPLRQLVLAFAPAQPRDGGAGATYVLLARTSQRLA